MKTVTGRKLAARNLSLAQLVANINSTVFETAARRNKRLQQRKNRNLDRLKRKLFLANRSLKKAMETVLSFHGFFAQHIKRADAPFGISVGDAFLGNGPKAFVIQTFGFGNTEGALSLVIHADCFRITRQTWSDDLRCFYHNPADCNGVYIDNEDLLDLLDQFSTPNKLVKELATIFILSERKLYKIN